MRIRVIIGLLMIWTVGCSTGRVISASEMQQAAQVKSAPVAPKVETWTGSWVELDAEAELVSPAKAKLRGTDMVISIVTTGWSSFETPKGESRQGWAEMQFILNGEVKRVRIEEDDYGFAHGYKIEVSYAFELWNEERAIYDPHVKYTVRKKSP